MKLFYPPLVSHQDAMRLVTSAVDFAFERKLAIVSCVVDTTGRIKAKLSMDGAPVIAETLVEKKAKTALLSMDSHAFFQAIKSDAAKLHSFAALNDITFLAGGSPLVYDGQLVGAFAVAGALPEQDADIAAQALKIIQGG